MIEEPTVGDPDETLERWRTAIGIAPSVFAGDGAVRYAGAIARVHPDARVEPPPLLAGAIGRLAVALASRGTTLDPTGVHPVYVRRPDAELAREEKRGAS